MDSFSKKRPFPEFPKFYFVPGLGSKGCSFHDVPVIFMFAKYSYFPLLSLALSLLIFPVF